MPGRRVARKRLRVRAKPYFTTKLTKNAKFRLPRNPLLIARPQ
jgi:hypothetical protein